MVKMKLYPFLLGAFILLFFDVGASNASDLERASNAAYCVGAMKENIDFWNNKNTFSTKKEQEIYEQLRQQIYEQKVKPLFEHYRNTALTYGAINKTFLEASLLLTLQGQKDDVLCKQVQEECSKKHTSSDIEQIQKDVIECALNQAPICKKVFSCSAPNY
jgi:hypothetical protein